MALVGYSEHDTITKGCRERSNSSKVASKCVTMESIAKEGPGVISFISFHFLTKAISSTITRLNIEPSDDFSLLYTNSEVAGRKEGYTNGASRVHRTS